MSVNSTNAMEYKREIDNTTISKLVLNITVLISRTLHDWSMQLLHDVRSSSYVVTIILKNCCDVVFACSQPVFEMEHDDTLHGVLKCM